MAKSAVNPIFSPPPHPLFFTPKSPFFPFFPVLNPISGDFSRDRARFLPCEVHFFLVFPRFGSDCRRFFDGTLSFFPFYRLFPFPFSHFESKLRRFFDGTSLFSAPKLTFSLLFPVFPHASGTSSRDFTLYFPRTPLFALREGFSNSAFPSLHPLLHLPISIDFLSTPHSPPYLHPSPSFSHIPPHFSISLPNKRTIARTLAHYARTRTPAHTHTSGGFRLLPSPLHPPSTIRCTSIH